MTKSLLNKQKQLNSFFVFDLFKVNWNATHSEVFFSKIRSEKAKQISDWYCQIFLTESYLSEYWDLLDLSFSEQKNKLSDSFSSTRSDKRRKARTSVTQQRLSVISDTLARSVQAEDSTF